MSVKSMHKALTEMAQNQSEAAAKSRLDDRRETNSRMLKKDFNKSGISHIHSTKTGPDGSKHDHFDIGKHTKVISTHNSYKVLHKGKETHYQGDPEHRDNRNRVIDKVLQHVGKNESVELDENYVKSWRLQYPGYKAARSAIMLLRKSLKPGSKLEKGISRDADNVKSEFAQMEKHIDAIKNLWDKMDDAIDMNVKESVELDRAAWVPESIADEQVEAFMEAALAAVAEGEDTFVFEAKHYKAKTKKEDKLDPVGQEDDDIDNDGDVDSSDKYLKKRRSAIAKRRAMDEEMDPTKHVSKKGDMYCVYNKDGEEVAKFDNEEEANAYARKNHDALMGKEESVEEAKINELSKGTLDRYRQVAYNDRIRQSGNRKKGEDDTPGMKKRDAGIALATKKSNAKGPGFEPKSRPGGDVLKFKSKKESVEESAGTAQHGPDIATSDTFQKQMGGGRSPREKEFVDMHKTEIGLDIEKVTAQNKQSMEDALKVSPGRMGDNLKNGDTSFVNPVKADIIDGITKALQQMKTNN